MLVIIYPGQHDKKECIGVTISGVVEIGAS